MFPLMVGTQLGDLGAPGHPRRLINQIDRQIRRIQAQIQRLGRVGMHLRGQGKRAAIIQRLRQRLQALYQRRAQLVRQLAAWSAMKGQRPKGKKAYYPATQDPNLVSMEPPLDPYAASEFVPGPATPPSEGAPFFEGNMIPANGAGQAFMPPQPWYLSPWAIGGAVALGALFLLRGRGGSRMLVMKGGKKHRREMAAAAAP